MSVIQDNSAAAAVLGVIRDTHKEIQSFAACIAQCPLTPEYLAKYAGEAEELRAAIRRAYVTMESIANRLSDAHKKQAEIAETWKEISQGLATP